MGTIPLSQSAADNLKRTGRYSLQLILARWEEGNYGFTCDYQTGQALWPATKDEANESYAAGKTGAIKIPWPGWQGQDYRLCFVRPT